MLSPTDAVPIAAKGFEALHARTRAFSRWWLAELRATLPQSLLSRIGADARPCLSLAFEDSGVRGRLSGRAVVAESAWSAKACGLYAISEWLATHALRREDVNLVVELQAGLFFRRDMVLPKAALAALPSILDQDILHRTPFEPGEIWHAAAPSTTEAAGDVVAYCHWIIRRDVVAAELARCGLTAVDIDALTACGNETQVTPIIALRDRAPADPPWASRAVRFMAVAAVATTLLGFGTVVFVETSTAARIENAITELREGDAAGAGGGDRAARLLTMKAGAGVLEVWEELSRLLPDHTFLTELRMTDGTVAITGFSSDAAHLVRVIEQSPLFAAAHLAGAITPDGTERKDRFSLAFQLRGSRAPAEPRSTAIARGDQ